MSGGYTEHPRKITVREQWDSPILNHFYDTLKRKYVYLGLPGPQAIDIHTWKSMIDYVYAFELEVEGPNPRSNIAELNRNLQLLKVDNTVFCGSMEEVVLDKEDYDGKRLNVDRCISLYNFDFCNRISSRIDTRAQERRCLRFEAIREIIAFQRQLYRRFGVKHFILLVTAMNSLHKNEVRKFVNNPNLSRAMKKHISSMRLRFPKTGFVEDARLVSAFIFTVLRSYFGGSNVKSHFFHPIHYYGTTRRSPMMHMAIFCEMGSDEEAQVHDCQSVEEYCRLPILCAEDTGLCDLTTGNPINDTYIRGMLTRCSNMGLRHGKGVV